MKRAIFYVDYLYEADEYNYQLTGRYGFDMTLFDQEYEDLIVPFQLKACRSLRQASFISILRHLDEKSIINERKVFSNLGTLSIFMNFAPSNHYSYRNMVRVEGKDNNIVANNIEPHFLTHPGEVIKDELEYRGISQRRLATEIGVPPSQLNEVLNAKRPLSAEMALLIGQALDLDAEPLLGLQMKYNLLAAKRNKSFFNHLKKIPRIAAAL